MARDYEETGPEILLEGVMRNARHKAGKATGPENIPVELLKLIDDEKIDVLVR